MNTCLRAYITGRVQGVFFRSWTQKQAQQLGLTGYVKNLPDGRVEIVAQGEKSHLIQFLEILRSGPKLAQVDHIDINWQPPPITAEFSDFHIRR